MKTVLYYLKAILAGTIAGLTALSTAMVDHNSFGSVDAKDWVTVALAFLVGLGVVARVSNGPNPKDPPSS